MNNFNLGEVLTTSWKTIWTLTFLRLTNSPEDAPVFVEGNA
ncbi:MAG: hypothetical protein Q8L41_07910 [Anaerolineales bacterium]|nr:hypothetical protein [Anaerolineales bacterium]